MITAEVSCDKKDGPSVKVTVNDTSVTVYISSETAIVERLRGSKSWQRYFESYGIEVPGPWRQFREMLATAGNAKEVK